MDRDDWPDTTDTLEVECEHCGSVRPCQLTVDPFLAEIYPESPNEPSYWCRACFLERLYDT